MANEDRVRDVYLRRIDTTATQDACRDRIHWLCEQVTGRRVIDIGCSQGITGVILAREGREVVGVDIAPEALATAEEMLAQEPPLVQQRVRFVLADAFIEEFEGGSFETAILGEILEHLTTPERLLERVQRWLAPGGCVVVSVPHGYHPYHDHKRTFYLSSLVELLNKWFTIARVDVIAGRFLGAVALKPPDGAAPQRLTVEQILTWSLQCHVALERAERQTYADRLTRQAEYLKLEKRAARLREQAAADRKALEELRVTVANQKPAAAQLLDQYVRVTKVLRQRLTAAQTDLTTARNAQAALQEKLRVAQQRTQAVEQVAKARGEQITKLKAAGQKQVKILQKSGEDEKKRRRLAEARIGRLQTHVNVYRAELAVLRQTVRYRLGDACVRAVSLSWDTLKLPFRVVLLLRDGLRRRRARRAADGLLETRAVPSPASAVSVPAAEPVPPSAAPLRATVAVAAASPPAARPKATPAARAAPAVPVLDGIPSLAEPFSNAPVELRRRSDVTVAAVTDEFSWRAWQYEADCYSFTPQAWRDALEKRRPDFLLVESTWSGMGDSWYFQVRDLGQRGDVIKHYAIPDIVAWCRARGIPTVFYNKEDPPHFDVFVDAAKQFDYVFTSDANCIDAYRKHLGHERVFSLPFAAQPRIHNPIMTGTRTGSVCFAGTWYAHRHFDRQGDAEKILRPALDFDLHIFDRRANSGDPNFRWPDTFLPAIRGALPYAQMLAAYKRYRVFLNVNSVPNSPTMFARRVFELLACGTPVISAYSPGIDALLGADVVLMSDSEARTRQLLEQILGDDDFREQLALRGQRKVFAEHTYTHRLQKILDTVGLKRSPVAAPALTMVASVADAAQTAAAWENYQRQEYSHKRLMLCATRADAVAGVAGFAGEDKRVSVVVAEGALWGKALEMAMADVQDYVCALHPQHHYGPHYLTDYAHTALYTTEPAFGKATHYQALDGTLRVLRPGQEYRLVSRVSPWTICMSRAHAQSCCARLRHAQTAEEWWNRSVRPLPRLFSADRFNYVHAADPAEGGNGAARAGHAPVLEPALV
jgi:spore maturation protein CgeB/SAM-dependent methyltransferase